MATGLWQDVVMWVTLWITPAITPGGQAMWSDTLLLAERAALIRMAVWGAGCVVAGSMILALLVVRRLKSPLLDGFAIQTIVWGAIALARVVEGMGALEPRDLAAATRLNHWVWFLTGLDVGLLAVGATLAVAGWRWGHRLGAVGAGLAIVVQGAGLLTLDARFATILTRLV
jgi:hypothetical protein